MLSSGSPTSERDHPTIRHLSPQTLRRSASLNPSWLIGDAQGAAFLDLCAVSLSKTRDHGTLSQERLQCCRAAARHPTMQPRSASASPRPHQALPCVGIGLGPLAGAPASVYPTDTVRDVAESLGINGMKESVAAALAADVEYRIREIVQDATKYMRHSKRDQTRLPISMQRCVRATSNPSTDSCHRRQGGRVVAIHPDTLQDPSSAACRHRPVFRSTTSRTKRSTSTRSSKRVPRLALDVEWAGGALACDRGCSAAVPQNPSPIAIAEAKGTSGFMGPTSTQPSASVPAAKAVTVAGGDGQAVAKPLVKHIPFARAAALLRTTSQIHHQPSSRG